MFRFFRTNLSQAKTGAAWSAWFCAVAYFGEKNDKYQREKMEAENPGYKAVYRFKPNAIYGGHFELELKPKTDDELLTAPLNKP